MISGRRSSVLLWICLVVLRIQRVSSTGPLEENLARNLFESDIRQPKWLTNSRVSKDCDPLRTKLQAKCPTWKSGYSNPEPPRIQELSTMEFEFQIFRNAMKDRQFIWPDGLVPYVVDAALDPIAVSAFQEAIKELETSTCLRFRGKTRVDTHHILVTSMGGCWSYVGRQEDRPDGQELSLSPLCWEKSTIQHEIMHALGFFHEHSRFDRDKYISINLENVEKKHWNQFDKRGQDETDLLTEYDYDSILHYHSYAWAKDKAMPTIIPTRVGAVIGQRRGYSKLDYEKINKLYRCYENTKVTKENVTTRRPPMAPPIFANITTTTSTVGPSSITTGLPLCPTAHMCEDKDPKNCPMLASQGWCEMMPGKMLFDCRKSCCNCDYTKCQDTNVHFYWQNYCFSGQYTDGMKTHYIHFPNTCQSPFTFQTAGDFCPKMCGRC